MNVWRSWWGRFWAAARGGVRQRITWLGFGYSAATAIVGAAAFLTGNNLLFLVLAALFATLMVAGFVSRLSLAGLQLDIELPPHPTARAPHFARIALKNEKTAMPSFSIFVAGAPNSAYTSRVYVPIIPSGRTVEATIEVTFARRGLHSENIFQLESRFPLGLTRRTVDLTLRREVIVYPSLQPEPEMLTLGKDLAGEIEAFQRGQGLDFYRIRPYETNESARHVDWRATAHTGALQVREFTREQEPLVEIYIETHILADAKEWFEHAVNGCAYLTWDLTRHGARLRLCARGFDRLIPADADVYAALEFLALVAPVIRPGEATPENAQLPPLRHDSLRVVFSPSGAFGAASSWRGAHVVDQKGYTGRPARVALRG